MDCGERQRCHLFLQHLLSRQTELLHRLHHASDEGPIVLSNVQHHDLTLISIGQRVHVIFRAGADGRPDTFFCTRQLTRPDVTGDEEVDMLMAQIATAPGMQRLRQLSESAADIEVLGTMLSEALRFARERLIPFDTVADREGCRLEQGRCRWPRGIGRFGALFARPDGRPWTSLPSMVASPYLGFWPFGPRMFRRASVSFGMLPGAARAAARLLRVHASSTIAQAWIPKLASGEWGATICISEADAGSDVGRIRTTAQRDAVGRWTLRGEKMWISYGDHDLTERIDTSCCETGGGTRRRARSERVFGALVARYRRRSHRRVIELQFGGSRRNWGCMALPPACSASKTPKRT